MNKLLDDGYILASVDRTKPAVLTNPFAAATVAAAQALYPKTNPFAMPIVKQEELTEFRTFMQTQAAVNEKLLTFLTDQLSWIAQRPTLFSRFFLIFYGLCSCWTLSYTSRSEQPRGIHVPSTWLRLLVLSYLVLWTLLM